MYAERNRCYFSAHFHSWHDLTRLLCGARTLHLAVHFAPKAAAFKTWKRYHILLARISFLDMIIFQTYHAIKTRTLKTWSFNVICQQKEALKLKVERFSRADAKLGSWKQIRLQGLLIKWNKLDLSRAWESWIRALSTNQIIRKMLFSWINRRIARCFHRWCDLIQTKWQSLKLLERIVNRWTHQCMDRAWSAWHSRLVERKDVHRILTHIILRWTHTSLSRAWVCWHRHAIAQRKQLKSMCKIVRVLKHRTLFRAHQCWRHCTEESLRKVQSATQAVARWQNLVVWQALQNWHCKLQDQKQIAERISNASIRWNHAFIYKVFVTWREQAQKSQHACAVVYKIIVRWQHFILAGAFGRLEQAVQLQLRGKRLVEKVVRRWSNLQLAIVLGGWHEHAQHKKIVASTMVKIIRRWRRMLLFKGFMWWQAAVEQVNRTRELLDAALRRWQHRDLGTAWASWSHYVAMQRRCDRIVKKIVHRWTHLTLETAMDQWKMQMHVPQVQAIMRRAAIGRMKNIRIWCAFARWHEATHQLICIKYISSKVVTRWVSSLRGKAIGTWLEKVRERRSMRSKTMKVLRKWGRHQLARAWLGWEDHSRRIKLAARAIAVMRHISSWKAISTWRENVCLLQSVRMRIRKLLLHWQQRDQSKALQSWQENARSRKLTTHRMSIVINKWQQGHLWRAFAAWQKRNRLVSVAVKALARLQKYLAFASLMRWNETTLQQKANACKLKKAVKTWTRIQEAKAFCLWHESTVWNRRCTSILQRALKRWVDASLCRAFNCWYSSCCLVTFARTILERVRNRCCLKAIRRWSAKTELHERLRQMTKKWKQLPSVRAWIAWDQWRLQKAEKRSAARRLQIMSKCRVVFEFQFLSTGFLTWRRSTRIRAAMNKVFVERWSSWFSLWYRLVELANLWRNAKLRALEIGQINHVRTYFKLFARGIEKQRMHDQYATQARLLVDQVQNAAQTQVAMIQEQTNLSFHQLEDKFQRKVLNARASRLLLSRNVINRMLRIRKAVLFDNLLLVSTLLRAQLVDAAVKVARICKRKEWAQCGRYLHRWVTEVQTSRIEVLEAANRDAAARVAELVNDKATLQALVEEALKEQDQLAVEYHTIIAAKAKREKRGRAHRSRSRSPEKRSWNPTTR